MSLIRLACLAAAITVLASVSAVAVLPSRHASARARFAEPQEEMRGMWVVRYSLTSPQAIRNIVSAAKSHNFNTLFVQVRGRGDAWYNSDIEPRADALAKQPSSFDPLAYMIEVAHQNGIKVNAWMNTYLVWTGSRAPRSPRHVINQHPDWIARDRNNHYTMRETPNVEGVFLQPSNPAVQDYTFRVFTDVARRYNVDGIHFDYVRYPGIGYDYSDDTLARFRDYMEPRMGDAGRAGVKADGTRMAYVHMFPVEWAEWRRAQVTALVSRISQAVHQMKPGVEVSAAVFADAGDAYAERGQDWRGWLAAGYLDAACPMAYGSDTGKVAAQIARAVAESSGKPIYAGLGSWHISADSTVQKIAAARAAGARGINLFSYDGMTRDGQSLTYLDYITRSCFASRVAAPRVAAEPGAEGVTRQ